LPHFYKDCFVRYVAEYDENVRHMYKETLKFLSFLKICWCFPFVRIEAATTVTAKKTKAKLLSLDGSWQQRNPITKRELKRLLLEIVELLALTR
jgi:hypothetical protein